MNDSPTFGQSLRRAYSYATVLPGLVLAKILDLLGVELRLYPQMFGHQTLEMEYCLRKINNEPRKKKIVFLRCFGAPNGFLLKKHKKLITVIELPKLLSWYCYKCFISNRKTEKWNILPAQNYEEMFQNPVVWNEYPAVLEFTDQEHEQGRRILREMGLEPGKYICFHTRESAYAFSFVPQLIAARRPKKSSDPNIVSPEESVRKFEKSLFQRYRHSDPLVYGKAMKSLADHGVKSVRVGAVVAGKLEISEPYVVDYAGQYRSQLVDLGDFADVYLMAHCKFFLGTATGVKDLAMSLNKPIVLVNIFPWPWINLPLHRNSIYIPKKVFNRHVNRIMTFSNLVNFSKTHDWRDMYRNDFILEHGFEVVDNTEIEINEAVIEMSERLDGHWCEEPSVEIYQSQLKALYTADTQMHMFQSCMSSSFLKRNAELI